MEGFNKEPNEFDLELFWYALFCLTYSSMLKVLAWF
jgi:hypothetical protein